MDNRKYQILLLSIMFAIVAMGCSGLPASFQVKGGRVDGSCSNIIDYCTRARCSVKNLSSKAAPAHVTFKLYQPDGSVVSAKEYVMLNPKESKEVKHDFKEARLLDSDRTRVECSAEAAR